MKPIKGVELDVNKRKMNSNNVRKCRAQPRIG